MLEIKDLCKSYKKKIVLSNISLKINNSSIVWYMGSNGCGKSTTFKMILDNNEIDSGEINLDGKMINQNEISYLPEKKCLYEDVTVYQQIKLIADINDCINADFQVGRIMEHFKIDIYKDVLISKLSKGNQQKVALACCFVKKARIYLLDEPFTALDKENSELLVNKILSLKEENKIIIVISHNNQYLNNVVDHYFYLDKGNIVIDVSKQQLLNDKRKVLINDDQQIVCKNYYQAKITLYDLLKQKKTNLKIRNINIWDLIKEYEETNNI